MKDRGLNHGETNLVQSVIPGLTRNSVCSGFPLEITTKFGFLGILG